jgi:hypothetical protein
MTNPTSNFGWQMPTSTDLVTDLPADFEVFGQAVDTSLADLKGGTSGQILAKATNADMDFTWITNDVGDITAVTAGTGISGGGTSGAVTITNSMATEIAAKGDLIVGTGSATFDNLGVGTNGQVLTADSTVSPTGLKWSTPSSGTFPKLTFVAPSANFTTSSTSYVDATGYTITFTPASATNTIEIKLMCGYAISGNIKAFRFMLDGVDIGAGDVLIGESIVTLIKHISNLSAASHTIKLQMKDIGGGGATLAGTASGYIADFSILEIY